MGKGLAVIANEVCEGTIVSFFGFFGKTTSRKFFLGEVVFYTLTANPLSFAGFKGAGTVS